MKNIIVLSWLLLWEMLHILVTGVKGVDIMASQVFPKRLTECNFGFWLKHLERCATANLWDAETHVSMVPAFSQGPAATYFESLTERPSS